MKLFRPVKPFIINQRFGENQACIPVNGGAVITCDGNNPPKGYKSVYGKKGHLGLDLHALHNQPVYCALDGVVDSVDTDPKSGLDVKVVSETEGRKFKHVYEHLLGYQPKIGDTVDAGSLIGWADNTGYSAGDHLHFQLEEWIKGKWVPVNPMLFMGTMHAQDIRPLQEMLARLADLIADWLRAKNGDKKVG